jgi:hypothetical protein
VQYVTKKEDLNKMRLSRYKMERYVYVRKGKMGGVGGERERESVFVCLFVYIFIYLFNNTVTHMVSCGKMITEQQVGQHMEGSFQGLNKAVLHCSWWDRGKP